MSWQWTVLALCVPNHAKRLYFNAYCEGIGVSHESWKFADYQCGDPFSQNSRQEIQDAIREHCGDTEFDWVFTHSNDEKCEYEYHANHVEIRSSAESLVGSDLLNAHPGRLVHFSYKPEYGCNGRATVASLNADFHLQLTYNELCQKCVWCMCAPDAFTSLSNIGNPCPNPEGFSGPDITLPEPFIRRVDSN